MKSVVLFLLAWAMTFPAQATTPEYIELPPPPMKLEFDLSFGLALQSGYLSTQDSVSSYSFAVNMIVPSGIFAFEWQGFGVTHDTGEFGFADQKKTRVSSFAFIPQARLFKSLPVELYLGLGLMNVGISQSSPDYLVYYGSHVFSGQVRYSLNPKWSVHYKTQWYEVSQTVNDRETAFQVWSHLVGVGYSF